MMDAFINGTIEVWEKLGAAAAGLIIVTYLLIFVLRSNVKERREHRDERDIWRESIERMHESNLDALQSLRDSNERMQDRNIEALTAFRIENKHIHDESIGALQQLTIAIKKANAKKIRRTRTVRDKPTTSDE